MSPTHVCPPTMRVILPEDIWKWATNNSELPTTKSIFWLCDARSCNRPCGGPACFLILLWPENLWAQRTAQAVQHYCMGLNLNLGEDITTVLEDKCSIASVSL